MRKIGFIGAFDKTDLIIYISKILQDAGKKVLVMDATILGKSRYVVPAITPTKFYVTEYEEIDIAVGFDDIDSVDRYLGNIDSQYDIALIDIDSSEMFKTYRLTDAEKIYFVTAFDNYSLRRGIEIISNIPEQLRMTKVMFEREVITSNEEYLNLISFPYAVDWDEIKYYFPYDQGDLTAIIENQRVEKIKFRNLSDEYKDSLCMISQEIIPDIKSGIIKKIIKSV